MKTEQNKTLESNALGVFQLIFLVVAAVGPIMSLFGLMTFIFYFGNGIGEPGIFIFASIVWLLFSVGFTAMARHVRNTGAFYAYISQGIGRPLGISASYLAILAYIMLQVSNYCMFGYTTSNFLAQHFDIHLTWWVCALFAVVLVAFFGYRHIEIGAKILAVLMLGEVCMMLLLSFSALGHPSPEGYTAAPFNPTVVFSGAVGIALMFSFGSFTGFESTAIFSEEVRNPRRNVPIATYSAVIILGALYSLASYATVVGWGEHGLTNVLTEAFKPGGDSGIVYTRLATRLLGPWSVIVMQVLLMTSVFAASLAIHNMTIRYYFSCGRTGILPAKLSNIHQRFRSPYVGSVIHSGISAVFIILIVLAGLDPYAQAFGWTGAVGALTLLILYTLTALAVIMFFARTKLDTRVWHTKIAPILAFLALGFATVFTILNFDLMVGEGQKTLSTIIFLFIIAVAVTGIVVARRLQKYRPDIYRNVGNSIAEQDDNTSESKHTAGTSSNNQGAQEA